MKNFLGINNIADETRLSEGEFTAATDVDIGSRGNLMSRRGRTLLLSGVDVRSVFHTPFGLLVCVDSDLLLVSEAGVVLRTVYPTFGYTRVWCAKLPDGRVAFSNGLIQGLCTASTTQLWGVPTPVDAGVGIDGGTLYQITYVRDSDRLEGPPLYGNLIDTTQAIIGLPQLAGHSINVYFAPYGDTMFLAGSTSTDTYLHGGGPLGAQFVGSGLSQPPVGRLLTVWNSRVLIADGNVLWATRPMQPEQIDLTQDFIQMPTPITALYGTGDGLFVGTEDGMFYLSGIVFREMKAQSIASGFVTLGSTVEIPLSYLNEKLRPPNILQGALCSIDGAIHLVHGAGQITGLTSTKYRAVTREVHATVRVRDGVMHYLAAPA